MDSRIQLVTFWCGKFFDVNCSGFYLNFFGIAVSIGSKCGKLAVTTLIRIDTKCRTLKGIVGIAICDRWIGRSLFDLCISYI